MTVDTHTLSGAYALDALEPGEVAAFEEHLAGCAACRQEVAEFRLVAAELAGAESFAPPPELRDRILAKAAHTRQLPPWCETCRSARPAARHAAPPAGSSQPRPRWSSRSAVASRSTSLAMTAPTSPQASARSSRPRTPRC